MSREFTMKNTENISKMVRINLTVLALRIPVAHNPLKKYPKLHALRAF